MAIVGAISFFVALEVFDAYSPLIDRPANYSITVEGKPEVCAATTGQIVFQGKICAVRGSAVSVLWDSLSNTNAEPSCGSEKYVQWTRRENDQEWNMRFVGSCGQHPDYFDQMPNNFRYKDGSILAP